MRRKRKRAKKKIEWSKFLSTAIALLFGVVGIWSMIRYYQLVELSITEQSAVAPDPGVAVACITTVIGALMSYLLYQAGLKNSRNKYGVDPDGQPFKTKNEDPYADDSEDDSAKG